MHFFCDQALGIIIEDSVQSIYRRMRGKGESGRENPIWVKMIGYAWVIAFLSWATPIWIYPVTLQTNQEDALLRFGAFRFLLPF